MQLQSPILPDEFDPSEFYEVELARPFVFGNRLHRPEQKIILRGDIAEQHRDALATAVLAKQES